MGTGERPPELDPGARPQNRNEQRPFATPASIWASKLLEQILKLVKSFPPKLDKRLVGFRIITFEARQEFSVVVMLDKSNFLKFVLELLTEARHEVGGFFMF